MSIVRWINRPPSLLHHIQVVAHECREEIGRGITPLALPLVATRKHSYPDTCNIAPLAPTLTFPT